MGENLNALQTSINISLKPQVWLCLFLTIAQSGIHISGSFLFPKENPASCSAIAVEAAPAINQSDQLWHTAQLAALTWYITQAVAAPHTLSSSREFHLMPWFCWIWSSREKEKFFHRCSQIKKKKISFDFLCIWKRFEVVSKEVRGSRLSYYLEKSSSVKQITSKNIWNKLIIREIFIEKWEGMLSKINGGSREVFSMLAVLHRSKQMWAVVKMDRCFLLNC